MRARKTTAVAIALLFGACGPGPRRNGDNCTSQCSALGFAQCHDDGSFDPPVACAPGEVCDPEHGCVVCVPDNLYCGGPTGNDVLLCNSDGTDGTFQMSCP